MDINEKLALDNCDKEPVHIPGRIQPFGSMLAFDLKNERVTHHSAGIGQSLKVQEDDLIGASATEVFHQREVMHKLRGVLSLPTIRSQRERIGIYNFGGNTADAAAYATDEHCVVELEPNDRASSPQTPVGIVKSMMSAMKEGDGLVPLLSSAVRALRAVTGHDRVMAYRFIENGDGEVVAEALSPGFESYLGLRYPAWDIPTQVRQIMLRAPFRVIVDVNAEHTALVQHPDAAPLDMTLSHLRGVSPIHVEYLSNMGVRATMNTSIIVRGQLWGLFAFHHYRPRKLTPDERSICELFGQLSSMMIQKEIEQAKLNSRQRAASTMTSIAAEEESVESTVQRLSQAFMETTDSDGMCLVREDMVECYGATPTNEVVKVVLAEAGSQEVLSINCLQSIPSCSQLGGQLGTCAGALATRLYRDVWLVFFRNEVTFSIRWAGGKEKEVKVGPNGPRLTPRGSFAEYSESVSGRCKPWSEEDLSAASGIGRKLLNRVQSETRSDLKKLERQKQYQDLLIAELNHRVRNTLALVRSIASQTRSSSTTLEQYVEALESRITALSFAHDLVGGSGLQWAKISDLVRAELKPYEDGARAVLIQGEGIAVRADVAPILALLFHEMTSNAVKHGALSSRGEQLKLTWYTDSGGVAVDWTETLNEKIEAPDRRGFGFALIERALPFECSGRSKISIDGNQLKIQFWLPADAIDASGGQSSAKEKTYAQQTTDLTLEGVVRSALVVEDNLVLAMEVEKLLRDLGVEVIETVPNRELAEAAMSRTNFDSAVLDINLGNENSFTIANDLIDRGTRVVLVSGYDSKYEMPDSLAEVARLTKPVERVQLVNAILNAI